MRRRGDKEEMGDSIGRWWQADVGDGCSLLAGCRCASPGPGSQVCGAEEHMKLWSYIKNLTRLITAWQLARCRAQVSRHRVWHVTPPSWTSVTIVFIWSYMWCRFCIKCLHYLLFCRDINLLPISSQWPIEMLEMLPSLTFGTHLIYLESILNSPTFCNKNSGSDGNLKSFI